MRQNGWWLPVLLAQSLGMATANLLLPFFMKDGSAEPEMYLHWKGVVIPIPPRWQTSSDGNTMKLSAGSRSND